MNFYTANPVYTVVQKKSGHRTGMKNIDQSKKEVLAQWVADNGNNPYPSEDEKQKLADQCDLTEKQVSNWFTNARKVSNLVIFCLKMCCIRPLADSTAINR